MADETLGQFESRIGRFVDTLASDWAKTTADKVGVEAKRIATDTASADLGGDPKFSGWVPTLDTRYEHVAPGVISFHPTKRSAGPWTVAEFGRHTSAGPAMVGPRLTKSGRVSKAKAKRWNGRTAGKGTATKALEAIDKRAPQVVQREVVKVIGKFFD